MDIAENFWDVHEFDVSTMKKIREQYPGLT